MGVLTAVFYGSIADAYGREVVLCLGFSGELLALS